MSVINYIAIKVILELGSVFFLQKCANCEPISRNSPRWSLERHTLRHFAYVNPTRYGASLGGGAEVLETRPDVDAKQSITTRSQP